MLRDGKIIGQRYTIKVLPWSKPIVMGWLCQPNCSKETGERRSRLVLTIRRRSPGWKFVDEKVRICTRMFLKIQIQICDTLKSSPPAGILLLTFVVELKYAVLDPAPCAVTFLDGSIHMFICAKRKSQSCLLGVGIDEVPHRHIEYRVFPHWSLLSYS